jgi:hypothetical protein
MNSEFIRGFKGLSEYLGISLPTARKLVKDGVVTSFRNRHVIFFRKDLLSKEMFPGK